jgi:hypothetical protein
MAAATLAAMIGASASIRALRRRSSSRKAGSVEASEGGFALFIMGA